MELPHAIYSSSRQGSSNRATRSRLSSHPEDSSSQMFHSLLGERDVYRRMNMDGIAEVLLALDRIEHDDELSYEEEGEEVGRMKCEHQHHVCCIQEWLRQKNWCPICKASAIPSDTDKGTSRESSMNLP